MIGEYYGQNVDIVGMKNKLLKSYFLLKSDPPMIGSKLLYKFGAGLL